VINIGLIPARKGSKRIKKKNLKVLGNQPLIQYSIENALSSNLDKVIISSDCDEIINFSKNFNVETIKRPMELAGDESTTFDVVKHVVQSLNKNENIERIFLLQPTCPFRPKNLINDALNIFQETECDSVTTYRKVDFFHPNRIKKIRNGKVLNYCEEEIENVGVSKLPPAYQRDGYLYSFRTEVLIKQNSFFGKKAKALIINENFFININNKFDWLVAESFLNEKK
tara:strand:+ start:2523 stop:3203 length:681 start_codon:yes stop_codon:yes gene_type:complete